MEFNEIYPVNVGNLSDDGMSKLMDIMLEEYPELDELVKKPHSFELKMTVHRPIEKEIDFMLMELYKRMGIDKPSNHDYILGFVVEDVRHSAETNEWTSEDVNIAFRRYIENQV